MTSQKSKHCLNGYHTTAGQAIREIYNLYEYSFFQILAFSDGITCDKVIFYLFRQKFSFVDVLFRTLGKRYGCKLLDRCLAANKTLASN